MKGSPVGPGTAHHATWITLSVVLFFGVFILIISVTDTFSFGMVLFGGALVLLLSLFSFRRTLFLLIFYSAAVPVSYWAESMEIVPFQISYPVLFGGMLLALFYWGSDQVLAGRIRLKIEGLDVPVLLFIAVVFLAALRGVVRSNPTHYVLAEIAFLLLYCLYFLPVHASDDRRWGRHFFLAVVLASFVVSVEFIYAAIGQAARTGAPLVRVVTQQPHIALISLPYLLTALFLAKKRSVRLLSLAVLFAVTLMILISQQRSLWVGAGLSMVVAWAIVLISRRKSRPWRVYHLAAFGLIFFILFLGGMHFLGSVVSKGAAITLASRASTIVSPGQDPSLLIRAIECLSAIKQVGSNVLLGNGLGDYIVRYIRVGKANTVDNSFVYFFWKMGLLGLFTFGMLTFVFFKRCHYVLTNAPDASTFQIAVTGAAAFSGLLAVALTNSCLALYRFNFVWALLLGTVELTARHLEKHASCGTQP